MQKNRYYKKQTNFLMIVLLPMMLFFIFFRPIYQTFSEPDERYFTRNELIDHLTQGLKELPIDQARLPNVDSLVTVAFGNREKIARFPETASIADKLIKNLTNQTYQLPSRTMWSNAKLYELLKIQIPERFLTPESLYQIFTRLMYVFLGLALLIIFLDYRDFQTIRRLLTEHNIAVSFRLILEIHTFEKDPFTGIKEFAAYLEEEERDLMKLKVYDERLEEVMQLVGELNQLLAKLYTESPNKTQKDYDYHNKLHHERSDRFSQLAVNKNPTYREFRLYKRWLRKKIQEVKLLLKGGNQKSAIISDRQPGIQWLNPMKRKHQKSTDQKTLEEVLLKQPEPREIAKPEWQVFFVTKADGQPIPLDLTKQAFIDLLKKYRPNVNAKQVFKRIKYLLSMTPDQRREVPYTMSEFYKDYRKHSAAQARIFFKVDESAYKLTFSAYLRTDLEKLGHHYL